MLRTVLRHEGEDRSALDVLRASLAAYEDRALLSNLAYEARRSNDERAGPDRRAEIGALARRADVEAAEERLRLAEIAVREAEKEHRQETRIWNEFHTARYGVEKARQVRSELDELIAAHERRARWIADHPSEIAWAEELEERLADAEHIADELASARRARAPMPRERGIKATVVSVSSDETNATASLELDRRVFLRRRAEVSIQAPESSRSSNDPRSPSVTP